MISTYHKYIRSIFIYIVTTVCVAAVYACQHLATHCPSVLLLPFASNVAAVAVAGVVVVILADNTCSLLEATVDVERATRVAPPPTAELAMTLLDMIKKRCLDGNWDDVTPR